MSLAEAINITTATVQDGVAVVSGGKAAANAPINWEGHQVATANKGGGFSFSGVVPSDCVGTLSDGTTTIDVALANCKRVLATGQTTAYTADKNDGIDGAVAVNDDGTLQLGAALNYQDNGDGTITDNNTGLMWEKKDDAGGLHDKDNGYVWSGNGTQETIWDWLDDLNAANFAGHNDWRIPNVKELMGIVNYQNVNPAVSVAFNNNVTNSFTQSDAYWSSTTVCGGCTPDAWSVNFFSGSVSFFSGKAANVFFVRAVRGGS